tara:strand:+ start:1152 stop:3188 length:2037 start_codon:yes stop_codon:yes gene_type:complete
MAVLTKEEEELVFSLINSGKEDIDVLDDLEGASREDVDYIIGLMRGSGEQSNTSAELVTPQDPEYNLDEPNELAQAISQKEGISFQEAKAKVALLPRSERAKYSGASFPLLSNVGDVATLPFRSLAGISSYMGGGDLHERMGQTKSEEVQGFLPSVGQFAEDAMLDPLTYAGGAVSKGLSKLATQAPKWLGGLKEGAVAGLGEFGLGNLQQEEMGVDTQGDLQQAGLQSVIGGSLGGTLGAVGGAFSKARYNKDIPTARQETRQAQKELTDIETQAVPSGVDADKWQDIHPMYRFGFNPELKPQKGEVDYKELLTIGKNSVENRGVDPLEHTFRSVGLPAYKEYGALKSKVGSEIGDIRKQNLQHIEPISKNELLENMNNDLMEYGGYQVKQVADMDGSNPRLQVVDLDGDAIDSEDMSPNIAKTLKFLDKMPQDLSGNKLELFRKQVMKNTPKDPITRQPIYDQDDMALKTILTGVKERIDAGIEEVAPEVAEAFKSKRAEYAKLSTNHQELGRLIGKSVDSDGIETTKKGTSAMKRVVQSLQDQGSRALWGDVKAKTGFDIERASARALQSMDEVGDPRSKSLLMEMGLMNEALQGGLDPKNIIKKKGMEAIEGVSDFVKPKGLAGLQVEQQLKRAQQPRGMLDLIEKQPYSDFSGTFKPYLESGLRSGLRGLGNN